jgi:rhodanese-related sulfurtransferase
MIDADDEDLEEPFTRVTVTQVKEMIENGDVQLVDVAEPREYELRHLPGAVNISVHYVYPRRDELSPDRDIVFVCPIGVRSALACEMAAAAGFTRLYNMEGGIEAWVKAGYPIEGDG